MNSFKTMYDDKNNPLVLKYHTYSDVEFKNNMFIYGFLFLTRSKFDRLDTDSKKEYISKYRLSLIRQLSDNSGSQYDSIVSELKKEDELTLQTFHNIISKLLQNKYQILVIENDKTYFIEKSNLPILLFLKKENIYYPVQINGISRLEPNGSEVRNLLDQMINDEYSFPVSVDKTEDIEDSEDSVTSEDPDHDVYVLEESDMEYENFNEEITMTYEQEDYGLDEEDLVFQLNMLLNGKTHHEPFVDLLKSSANVSNQNKSVKINEFPIVDVSRKCEKVAQFDRKSVYTNTTPITETSPKLSVDTSTVRSTIPSELYSCVKVCDDKSFVDENEQKFNEIVRTHSIEYDSKEVKGAKKICRFLENVDFMSIHKKKLYMSKTLPDIQQIARDIPISFEKSWRKPKLISAIIDQLPYPPNGVLTLDQLRQIAKDHKLPFSDTLSIEDQKQNYRHVNILAEVSGSGNCSSDSAPLQLKQYLNDSLDEQVELQVPHKYEYINVLKQDLFSTTGLFIQNGISNDVPLLFNIDEYFQILKDTDVPCDCDVEFFSSPDTNESIPYGSVNGTIISRENGTILLKCGNQVFSYPLEKITNGDFSKSSFYVFPNKSNQFRYNKKEILSNNIVFHSKLQSTEFIHRFVSMTLSEYVSSMKPVIPYSLKGVNQFLEMFDANIFNIGRIEFDNLMNRMKTNIPTMNLKKTQYIGEPLARVPHTLFKKQYKKVMQFLTDQKNPVEEFLNWNNSDYQQKFETVFELEEHYTKLIETYYETWELETGSKDIQRHFTSYNDLVQYKSNLKDHFDSVSTKHYNSRLLRMKSLHHNSQMTISSYENEHKRSKLFAKLSHDRQQVCSEMSYVLHSSTLIGEVSPFKDELTTESIGQHAQLHKKINEIETDVHQYFKILKIQQNESVIQHIIKQTPVIVTSLDKRLTAVIKSPESVNLYVCVGFVCILVYLRICKVSHQDKTIHRGDEGWMWDMDSVIEHFSSVLNTLYTLKKDGKTNKKIGLFINFIQKNDILLKSLIDNYSRPPPTDVDKSNLHLVNFKPIMTEMLMNNIKPETQSDLFNKRDLIQTEQGMSYKRRLEDRRSVNLGSLEILNHSEFITTTTPSTNRYERSNAESQAAVTTIEELFQSNPDFQKIYYTIFKEFKKNFLAKQDAIVMYYLILPNLPLREAFEEKIIDRKKLDMLVNRSNDSKEPTSLLLFNNIYNLFDSIDKAKNEKKLSKIVKTVINNIVSRYNESLKNKYSELMKFKKNFQEEERQTKIRMNFDLSDEEWDILKILDNLGIKPDKQETPGMGSNNMEETTDDTEHTHIESTDPD